MTRLLDDGPRSRGSGRQSFPGPADAAARVLARRSRRRDRRRAVGDCGIGRRRRRRRSSTFEARRRPVSASTPGSRSARRSTSRSRTARRGGRRPARELPPMTCRDALTSGVPRAPGAGRSSLVMASGVANYRPPPDAVRSHDPLRRAGRRTRCAGGRHPAGLPRAWPGSTTPTATAPTARSASRPTSHARRQRGVGRAG